MEKMLVRDAQGRQAGQQEQEEIHLEDQEQVEVK